MNSDLKDALERAERYIFLGLPYEKWYFQMVLRILSLHSDKLKEVERLALRLKTRVYMNCTRKNSKLSLSPPTPKFLSMNYLSAAILQVY